MLTYTITVTFDKEGLDAVIQALDEATQGRWSERPRDPVTVAMLEEYDRLRAMRQGDVLYQLAQELAENSPKPPERND